MNQQTMSVILWVAAAVIFALYMLRRKNRKTKSFR